MISGGGSAGVPGKLLIQAAMTEDFSWERSAGHYEAAYAQAIANKKRLG